jgi:hypothetical protein
LAVMMENDNEFGMRPILPWLLVAALVGALGAAVFAGAQPVIRVIRFGPDSATAAAKEDSLRNLKDRSRSLASRTTAAERLSEEKDTLIQTLGTAMVLFNELAALEREIVSERGVNGEGSLEPWDTRVRGQLQRLRQRYADLAGDLTRTQSRLRTLQGRDRSMQASLAEAMQTAAALREDNIRKQRLIDELTERVGLLTQERDAAVALSVARADTIQRLEVKSSAAYWTAGTAAELKRLGLIETVGGRHLVFTRVGESLLPARDLKANAFQTIDRRFTRVIDLPDGVEFEIVSQQNVQYADPATLRRDGPRWFVRNRLTIRDGRFWDPSPYLILVRD